MADEPRAARRRSPGTFKVFKATGRNEEGKETFVLEGEEMGLSAKAALEKAMETGVLNEVKLGDELAVVNERHFQVRPAKLSF